MTLQKSLRVCVYEAYDPADDAAVSLGWAGFVESPTGTVYLRWSASEDEVRGEAARVCRFWGDEPAPTFGSDGSTWPQGQPVGVRRLL